MGIIGVLAMTFFINIIGGAMVVGVVQQALPSQTQSEEQIIHREKQVISGTMIDETQPKETPSAEDR